MANPPTVGCLPRATPDAGSQRVPTGTRAHRASSCAGVTGSSALQSPPGNGASRGPCEHPGHRPLRTNERTCRELRGGASWLPPVRRVRGLAGVTLIDSSVPAGRPSAHPGKLYEAAAGEGAMGTVHARVRGPATRGPRDLWGERRGETLSRLRPGFPR